MYCKKCGSKTEASFRFCPKCGARRRLFMPFFASPKSSTGVGRPLRIGFFLILILSMPAIFFWSRPDLKSLRQGHRPGLAYAEWIALHKISIGTLGKVLGTPVRTTTLSTNRKIYWFQIEDGFLGIESPAQIIHFRPHSSKSLDDLPARYGPPSARYVVNNEVISNYSTTSQLALTTLASSRQERAIKEVILWRIDTL